MEFLLKSLEHFKTYNEYFLENFLFYKPHKKQVCFHNLQAQEVCFSAGNRTGKTFSGVMQMAFDITGVYPPFYEGIRCKEPGNFFAAGVTRQTGSITLQGYFFGNPSGKTLFERLGAIPPHKILKVHKRGDVIFYADIRPVSSGISKTGRASWRGGVLLCGGR